MPMNLRPFDLFAAIFALVLLMPSVVRADPYQDFERIVGSLQELGYIEQAADLQASLEQVPEAQFRAVAGEVNVAALAAAFEDAVPAAKKLWAVEHQFSSRRSAGSEAYDPAAPSDFPTSSRACPDYPNFDPTTADQTKDWHDALDLITAFRAEWNVARAVATSAKLVCSEVVVVLGEGANLKTACIPFVVTENIAKALLDAADDGARIVYAKSVRSAHCNARLTGLWAQANYDELKDLQDSIFSTNQLTGPFQVLANDLDDELSTAKSKVHDFENDIEDFRDEVDVRLGSLQEDIEKLLKVVKAQGLSRYGGSRWNDGYYGYGEGGLAQLSEVCDQAQAAWQRADTFYQVGQQAEKLITEGQQLILEPNSRRQGFELCRAAYRLVTEKAYKAKASPAPTPTPIATPTPAYITERTSSP